MRITVALVLLVCCVSMSKADPVHFEFGDVNLDDPEDLEQLSDGLFSKLVSKVTPVGNIAKEVGKLDDFLLKAMEKVGRLQGYLKDVKKMRKTLDEVKENVSVLEGPLNDAEKMMIYLNDVKRNLKSLEKVVKTVKDILKL